LAGRDPTGFNIRANLIAETGSDGRLDVTKTLRPVPRLADAGVTHFQLSPPLPSDFDDLCDYLVEIVASFRAVTDQFQVTVPAFPH
jgi:hypothetical protein